MAAPNLAELWKDLDTDIAPGDEVTVCGRLRLPVTAAHYRYTVLEVANGEAVLAGENNEVRRGVPVNVLALHPASAA